MSDGWLTVDGLRYGIALEPDRSLLEVLRDDLGLTAAKYGCGEGQCGACKVLVDGVVVPACITPVANVAGHVVTTTAGLAGPDGLHPVQRAFMEEAAMQCGYCTPGMVMAAVALLAADPHPADEAITAALEGNVCRCCAYPRILRAVRRAAAMGSAPVGAPARSPAPATHVDFAGRPPAPWDLTDLSDRDWFAVLPDGLVVVLPPERVPEGVWSASGGAWIHMGTDGNATAFSGKVDVGQGNQTALAQLVAEELGIPLARVGMVMGDTDVCPYDAGTYGSLSTPEAGEVLRRTAAAARMLVSETGPEAGTRRVEVVTGDTPLVAAQGWKIAGTDASGPGLEEAVTGARKFTSDVIRPGMLYGAVLRPPSTGADLVSADLTAAEAMTAVVAVHDGPFVGCAAPTPSAARYAVEAIDARWRSRAQPSEADLAGYLEEHPAESEGWGGSLVREAGDVVGALASAPIRLTAIYTTSYLAHVPLEPRVAVAEWDRGRLTVWTGTQRPFGVRQELAAALQVDEADVRVIVPHTGSGFGGKHSWEAAVEAARLARAAGAPVKVAWTREEEFAWGYLRPAAVITITSGASNDGRLLAWDFRNLNSGAAGIEAPYEVPHRRVASQEAESPLRQGSYRALAATANHFARESHIDELAVRLGSDPVELRLRHIADERLAHVLRLAADRAGWDRRTGGAGLGIACGVEKDAYVATCAEVRMGAGGEPEVRRVVTTFDCGAIVNPDNLVNQVEGATIMGLGGALHEAIHFEGGRILNARLSEYRVPRFSEVPEIEVILVDRRQVSSAGAGETPIVAVAPAVANAVFDLTGVRRRALPLFA
jgi:nicotinate dehydrogenase subunit B